MQNRGANLLAHSIARRLNGSSSLTCALLFVSLGSTHAVRAAGDDASTPVQLEEIVVTGVMTSTKLEEAPIAISAIDTETIEKQVPISAADLLKNVPGVFVNSSLGEIRNVVFSRGVSANSLDAASGYYYVSLQEDGLPVTNVTFTNYGPDYLYRTDVTLGRLEALRGGTANVTGPNAPGGIFNYISRTGASNPGSEVRARYGLEGDGKNPFYRADFYNGDRIAGTNLSYSVGGFYRKSDGARYPGYPLNKGGQIKFNLAYDFTGGSVQLYAKHLDDHNGWFEFLPAKNFNDPKLVNGIDSTNSFLPPRASHLITSDGGASFSNWDASNIAHSKSSSVGVKWTQDFGGRWSLTNNLKYGDNRVDWNSGAVIFPVALDDFFNYILINTFSPQGAGLYTFKEHGSGRVLAQVQSFSGFDHTVVLNNLPNQQVLQNGVLTQAALNSHPKTREWMDQLSVSKHLDNMTFTLGGFAAVSKVSLVNGGGGFGLSPIENQPQLMDITLTTPSGAVQSVTSPAGFADIGDVGGAGTKNTATQTQLSAFFGHNWQITTPLSLDWGIRYERMHTSGGNSSGATPIAADATGGLDGNVNTLYDNSVSTYNTPLHYSKTLNFFNFTGALSYKFSSTQFGYVRYSDGKKAPDLAFYMSLNAPSLLATKPVPQHIQQFELGYRLNTEHLTLTIDPFYSKLGDIGALQPFTDNTTGAVYNDPVLYSKTITYGVEIESDLRVSSQFNVHAAVTVQDPQSKDFKTWVQGATRVDDSIATVPDGDADNNPKLLASATLNYSPVKQLQSFLTWRYTGKRAANRYNTWYMPGFSQFDFGATFDVTEKLSFALNINNLLNDKGVMSWAKAGGFLSSLDRQNFTPADLAADPNQTFSIITIQPRSYYLSATYKF